MKELELDSTVNLQVQSAIDSIISCGTEETASYVPDDSEKVLIYKLPKLVIVVRVLTNVIIRFLD